MNFDFAKAGQAIGSTINSIGTYSAQAAARANSVSRQAQSAQGAFNQESANIANGIDAGRLQAQYGFNSAMMGAANQYNSEAWAQAADWNEEMWQKQADFNAKQAELNRQFNAAEAQKARDWQTNMSNTAYQRAMADMSKAGLNPILAYSQGGANVPGGATASGTPASVGGAQMSSASSQMASGGLLGASSANESNFTGQMEQMSTTLALIGAIFSGLSSAQDALGDLGDIGEGIAEELPNMLDPEHMKKEYDNYKESVKENGGFLKTLKDTFKMNQNGEEIGKNHIKGRADEAQFLRYNAWNKSTYKYTRPKG